MGILRLRPALDNWTRQLGGAGAAPWTPAQTTIGGVLPGGWWKADALTGLSDDAGVASWTDSSGNGKTLVQATGAAQPTYKTGILNGLPVARFDGTTDQMEAASGVVYRVLFAVLNYTNAATFDGFDGAVGNATQDFTSDSNSLLGFDGTTVIYTTRATGSVTPRINGVATNQFAPLATHKLVAMVESLDRTITPQLGNHVDTAGRFWGGDIAEVILYPALSAGDIEQVEEYLGTKWGVAP